jgi:hypothetical protein
MEPQVDSGVGVGEGVGVGVGVGEGVGVGVGEGEGVGVGVGLGVGVGRFLANRKLASFMADPVETCATPKSLALAKPPMSVNPANIAAGTINLIFIF